jgi:hypothetical protein
VQTFFPFFKTLKPFFRMTSEMIEKFVEAEGRSEASINIYFKQRSTVTGLFIKTPDYKELKSKNFWRIVTKADIEVWKKTRNMNLVKIFNGTEFTKLSEAKS